MDLKACIFECLVPSWWACLGRIRWCGLVGEDVSLGVGIEFQKHHDYLPAALYPVTIPTPVKAPVLNDSASTLYSLRGYICFLAVPTRLPFFFLLFREGRAVTLLPTCTPSLPLLFVIVVVCLHGPCCDRERREVTPHNSKWADKGRTMQDLSEAP